MNHKANRAFALLAAISLTCVTAGVATAQPADSGLTLTQGDIFTNDVGTVIGVSVTNHTSTTVGSVGVTCAFTVKGAPAGSASTTIFNIVAGEKGQDQVHLMGPKADAATCSITSTAPPPP